MRERLRAWKTVLIGSLAVTLVVALALWLRPANRHFEEGGLAFDYPSSWDIHYPGPSTGMGQTFAILGTLPWGPCGATDVNCHFQERLDRGEIQVDVGITAGFGTDFCTWAAERPDLAGRTAADPPVSGNRYFRVDGRPAIETTFAVHGMDYYLSDEWRIYRFAAADGIGQTYVINASYRGPGLDGFHDALDRLIASIHLTPIQAVVPPVPDCGSPFPAT